MPCRRIQDLGLASSLGFKVYSTSFAAKRMGSTIGGFSELCAPFENDFG